MRDCDGNELKVGDRIATQRVKYKDLEVKEIIAMTAKRVTVEDKTNLYNIRHIHPLRVCKTMKQPGVLPFTVDYTLGS